MSGVAGTHQVSGVTNCPSSEYSTGWSTGPGSDNWSRQMRTAHTRPGQSLRPLGSYQISIIDKHSIQIQSIIRVNILILIQESRFNRSMKIRFNCKLKVISLMKLKDLLTSLSVFLTVSPELQSSLLIFH